MPFGSVRWCRLLTAILLLLTNVVVVHACMWDYDTIAMEADKFPDLPSVITGRFPHYPKLYYQMRLKRVAGELPSHPEKLENYDDAGVACDRLGDDRTAIEWMAKKRRQLETLDAKGQKDTEHWYRYHANLGTFQAHQWLRDGAKKSDIALLKAGRAHIAEAIQINPDAHFGREKYQLIALDWLLDPDRGGFQERLKVEGKEDIRKAIQGISGLIVLGNAWESVDMFDALAALLAKPYEHSANVAHLATLRVHELLDDGKVSLVADSEARSAFVKELDGRINTTVTGDNHRHNEKVYRKLRDDAEAWNRLRNDYMMARLVQGFHPDTDPHFWDEYVETPPPSLEYPWPEEWLHQVLPGPYPLFKGLLIWLGLPAVVLTGFIIVRFIARRRKIKAS